MRIGCLQFNPQVGDVDNNLSRADSVLLKANPDDLDLLVLPEMAFTGYNFKSLREISPFLEPSGSGISSLWARTTALRYNCHVVVGYPEKVDAARRWPTSPEHYNSAIVVNPDGETVANYRKSHLFYTDETWALESTRGFYRGYIPCLGQTSIGICMDLNPYKFQSPWDAFEFGYHVLHSESNLVIVSMAWNTLKDRTRFTSMPYEPDLESLAYWATRLEPVIRAEDDQEVIVVFANRCGTESETVYAGTSAVIGIKGGEVSVYGLLGRGEKELLVVDTEKPAFAKMVLSPGAAAAVADDSPNRSDASIAGMLGLPPPSPPPPLPQKWTQPRVAEEAAGRGMEASSPVVLRSPPPSVGSGPKRTAPRPSPPKLAIPHMNGVWRKNDLASHGSGDPGSLANSAPAVAEGSGALADWLVGQAKVTASHPKPSSKPTPDSGIDVLSPDSFPGMGVSSGVRTRSPSPSRSAATSTRSRHRHRRNPSRTSESGYTVRSGRSSSKRAPSAHTNGDESREERRERRERQRIANFKDSPRAEQPDEVILGKFLEALAHAAHEAPEHREGGEEQTTASPGDDIKTSTLDIPEDIMIGASPSVLGTSFPPIPPLPTQLHGWQNLHSGMGPLVEERDERGERATSKLVLDSDRRMVFT